MEKESVNSALGSTGTKADTRKKTKKVSPNSSEETTDKDTVSGSSEAKSDNLVPSSSSSKEKTKSILDLICEGIEQLSVPRKGASYQEIKKYVLGEHGGNERRVVLLIKKGLEKGVEKGIIIRPHSSKDLKGATGHFLLNPKKPKATTKSVVKKRNLEKPASDTEIDEKPNRQMKRRLSDTYIKQMDIDKTSTPKPLIKKAATSKDSKIVKKIPTKKKEVDDKDNWETEMSDNEQWHLDNDKISARKQLTKQTSASKDSKPIKGPVKKKEISDTEISEQKKRQLNNDKTSARKPPTKQALTSKDSKNIKKNPVKKNKNDRKDTSDTEIVVKKKERKSMKSYSSDTEVGLVQKKEISKKNKTNKPNSEKSELALKTSRNKGVKKLYNSSEGKSENETNTKTVKTKAKKKE